jgi:hypothetical protein
VKVHCNEGVANRIGAEPCAGVHDGVGEASVGACRGQLWSRERALFPREPTLSALWKAIHMDAIARASVCPGAVVEPGMCTRSLYGNRETSRLAISNVTGAALIRVVKVSRMTRHVRAENHAIACADTTVGSRPKTRQHPLSEVTESLLHYRQSWRRDSTSG